MAKKKYSVNWENGEAVSFVINGVTYASLDQIPDRRDLQRMLAIISAADQDEELGEQPQITQKMLDFPIEKVVLTAFSGIAAVMLLIALISSFSAISSIMKEKSAPIL